MIDFNIQDYSVSVLPTGTYTCVIKNTTIKPTKSCMAGKDTSQFLSIDMEVIEGFRKGAHVFDNPNIFHVSEMTQKIARQKLAQLCDAVNIIDLKHIDQLIGKIVTVEVSEEEYEKKIKNRVDKYLPTKASPDHLEQYEQLAGNPDKFDDAIPF